MYTHQHLMEQIQNATEEQVKQYLQEIFSARQYGNQEMIQTINEVADRIAEQK